MGTKVKRSKILKLCVLAVLLSISLIFVNFKVWAIEPGTSLADPQTETDENGNTWIYTLVDENNKTEGDSNNFQCVKINSLENFGNKNGVLEIPSEIDGKEVISVGNGQSNILQNLKSNESTNVTITNIEFPDSVKFINNKAFSGLTTLTSITGWDNVTEIGNNAFNECDGLTEIVLPNSLKTLGQYAFSNCDGLTNLNFDDNLEIIDDFAFANCTELTGSLTFPEKVKTIGNSAFINCCDLNGDITFEGECLVSIGSYAFQNCTKIHKIILPKCVQSLGTSAFNGLTDVWIDGNEDECTSGASTGCFGVEQGFIHYKDEKIKVEADALEGIQIIDNTTGEEFVPGNFNCEDKIDLKFIIKDKKIYNNLKLYVSKEADFQHNENDCYEIAFVNGEANYKIDRLLRDYEFLTLDIAENLDLSVRTYLEKHNDVTVEEERKAHYELENCEITYTHTKVPVTVKTGDTLVYKIKVYNEGKQGAYAKKVLEYLPEGLEFKKNSEINKKYGWTPVKNKSGVYATDYLESEKITGYNPYENIDSKELEIECIVTAEKGTEINRLTNFAEIKESCTAGDNACVEDIDSVGGNLNVEDYSNYKYEESKASNSNSFIKSDEDDTDFENVVVLRDVPVSYTIKISKIDLEDYKLLNGAKFDLMNEDGQVIQSKVTVENGVLEFDQITTYGSGKDIYYINEVESPEGYIDPFGQVIKITVIKTVHEEEKESYTLQVICEVLETKIDTRIDENSLIPIYTKEQLEKVGSGDKLTIEGTEYTLTKTNNYRLMNDIDISKEEWKPLPSIEGIFDGNGHKITGLKITDSSKIEVTKDKKEKTETEALEEGEEDETEETEKESINVGLFGEFSGIITNLELDDVDIDIELQKEDEQKLKDLEEKYNDPKNSSNKAQTLEEINQLLSKYHIGGFVGKMKGGSIKASSIDGTIKTTSNNVGGFAGYAEKGYLTKITDSTNNAKIETEQSNAGGFIGYSYSALSLVNCTNNGKVNAEKYNSAGLVGCSEATDYKADERTINYDEENHILDLVIGNNKYTGKYSLKLEKIDNLTKELIDGTHFTIYNADKEAINKLENVEVEDGVLDIGTFEIKASGVDTYFIKEISTIDGYDLIKDYIKINVVKTWDGKQGDFKVHLDSFNVDTEKFEESKDTSAKEPTSKTDGNYDIDSNSGDKVSWLVNKVVATECTNTADITAKVNASGIFAKTKCIVDIEKSTNTGNITAKNHSAGLLSEALKVEKDDDNTNIIINECSNSGNIVIEKVDSGDTDIGIGAGSANTAGILADTEVFTIVKGTNNSGKVSGLAQTLGGIVANAKNSIVVDKCNNTADVVVDESGYSDYVAGIVARNLIAGTTMDITNSTNTGNIKSKQVASGILGISSADKIKISDCNASNCTIDGSGIVSGILAFSAGNIYINGCNTPNIHLNINNGSNSSIGAIVGLVCGIYTTDLSGNSKTSSPIVVDIEDCKIQKMQQTGSADEVGGVVGKIINTNTIETIKFKNCKVEDSEIKMQRFSKAGMLYANALYYKTLDVDNCDVISSSISSDNGCSEGSMLIGTSYSTSSTTDGLYTNVNDCDIISSHLNVSGTYNFGNIISYLTGSSGKNSITISNCKVNDSKINTNSAALIGNIAGALYEMNDIVFTDCEINNSPIELKQGSQNYISSCIGMTKTNNLKVKNIKVTDSSIESQNGAGGILIASLDRVGYGSSTNSEVTFENCNLIDNSMIIGNPKNSYNPTSNVGFLMGYNQLNTANIKNIAVKGEKAKQNVFGYQTGIIGYTTQQTNIDNLTLDNYKYSYTGSQDKLAGVVGMVSYSSLSLKNSKISNLDFEAPSGSAICNCSTDKVTVDNVEVQNIKISTTNGYDVIGGLVGFTSGGLDLTNSKIDNIDVRTSETGSNNIVSGIVAYSGGESNISNNTVTNINIENKNRSQNLYTVAGIIGIQNSNLKYNNNNNSYFTLIGDNYIGGIVGILPYSIMDTSSNDNSKNTLKYFTLESKGNNYNPAVAGLVAIGGSLSKIYNVDITDIDLKATSNTARIGGIAGTARLELQNCNVTDIDIENNHIATTIPAIQSSCIGGIAGVNINSSTNSSSLKVENATIAGTAGYVGGIYGCSQNNVTNSSFIDGNITISNEICAGGIYGYDDNSTMKATGLTVEEVNISGEKGWIGGVFGKSKSGISDVHVQQANISLTSEEGVVGGIVGFDCNNITISDSDVYFSTIANVSKEPTNKERYNELIYPAGGIAGFSSGTIERCDIYDSEIKSTGDNAYATGGIVGHGYNFSSSPNGTIYTKVTECNVVGCTITGNDGVGGIAGVAVPKIENCNVELTTAQSTEAQSVEPVVKIEGNVDGNVNQNQETAPVQQNILAEQNVVGNISVENSKLQENSQPQENDITNNSTSSEEPSTKEEETEEEKSQEEKDEAEKAKEKNKLPNNLEQNQENSNTEIKTEVDENTKPDESVVSDEVESEPKAKTNETVIEDVENEERDTANENDIMSQNISVENEDSIDEVNETEIDTEIIQSDIITENSETNEEDFVDGNTVDPTEQASEEATQDSTQNSTQNVLENSEEDSIDDVTEEKTEDKEDEVVEDSNENESSIIPEDNENDVTSEKDSKIDEEEISDEASKEESSENTESVQEPQEVEQKVEMIPQSTIVDNFIKNDNLLNATTSSIESIVPNTFVEVVAKEEKESEVKGKMCVGGIIGCGGILFTPYMFPLDLDNCTVSDTTVQGETDVDDIVGKNSQLNSSLSNATVLPDGITKEDLKDKVDGCQGENCTVIPEKKEEP